MGPNGRLRMFPSNTKSIGRHYLTILGAAGPDAATLAGRASSRNCLAARPLGRRQSHADPWRNTGRIINSTTKKSSPPQNLPLGKELNVGLFQVFIGLWDEWEVPLILEEYGLLNESEFDAIFECTSEVNAEGLLIGYVRR